MPVRITIHFIATLSQIKLLIFFFSERRVASHVERRRVTGVDPVSVRQQAGLAKRHECCRDDRQAWLARPSPQTVVHTSLLRHDRRWPVRGLRLAVCDSAEEEINGVTMQETYDRKERGMKCNYFGDKKNRQVRARRSFPGWRARGVYACSGVSLHIYNSFSCAVCMHAISFFSWCRSCCLASSFAELLHIFDAFLSIIKSPPCQY